MTLRELAESALPRLAAAGIDDARIEARLLACHAAQVGAAAYYAGCAASAEDTSRFEALLGRRLQREPLAYITGEAGFFGHDIAVGPGVLIPRPETESLVELALQAAGGFTRPRIVDVGTGSGCLALAIANSLPEARIIALDASPAALAVARTNVATLAPGVALIRGSLVEPIRSADIVVANLPYIPSDRIPDLQPEVRDWEPRGALDGGPDGTMLIRALIADCAARLRPSHLLLEVDAPGASCIAEFASGQGACVTVHHDLAGLDRFLWVRW